MEAGLPVRVCQGFGFKGTPRGGLSAVAYFERPDAVAGDAGGKLRRRMICLFGPDSSTSRGRRGAFGRPDPDHPPDLPSDDA